MADLVDVLEKADAETLHEIVREAESYLSAQATLAIAADARAMAFTSLLAAASAVIGAAAITVLVGDPAHLKLGIAAAVVTLGFVLAMLLAIIAGRPSRFEILGNEPSNWDEHINANGTFHRGMAEQAAHYDGMIKTNNRLMKVNGRWMKGALWTAWLSLVWGIAFVILGVPQPILQYATDHLKP